jgi:hypothetical protein
MDQRPFVFFNEKLDVYYYRDPVTHYYNVDQRPIVFFNVKLYVYYYRDPVTH